MTETGHRRTLPRPPQGDGTANIREVYDLLGGVELRLGSKIDELGERLATQIDQNHSSTTQRLTILETVRANESPRLAQAERHITQLQNDRHRQAGGWAMWQKVAGSATGLGVILAGAAALVEVIR